MRAYVTGHTYSKPYRMLCGLEQISEFLMNVLYIILDYDYDYCIIDYDLELHYFIECNMIWIFVTQQML